MLSIGIIWNSAQEYRREILEDMKKKVIVKDYFDMDLQEKYVEFISQIYRTENMESWKIENKIRHMILNDNTRITVVFFEFDEAKVVYHPFKKKEVYEQLETTKKYIREKYRPYVDHYTFDIIFHATDNLEELKNCYQTIMPYMDRCVTDEPKDEIIREYVKKKEYVFRRSTNGCTK